MTKYQHPMRKLSVVVYEALPGHMAAGRCLAMFEPAAGYPIYFTGGTEAEVRKKALDFRDAAVAKHEKAYINRQRGLAARRRKRGRK